MRRISTENKIDKIDINYLILLVNITYFYNNLEKKVLETLKSVGITDKSTQILSGLQIHGYSLPYLG